MAGRPSKYRPEMCERVVALMSEGSSITEVAADLGITRETLNQWEKDDRKPEFAQALSHGRELAEAWWLREGRTNLTNKEFSYTGWYMNMKNRFGWRDKQDVDHNHRGSINHKHSTTEQLIDDLRAIRKRRAERSSTVTSN